MEIRKVYMERCLQLARLGIFEVSPNPMVGCVIVHNDRIIGEGYHHRFGGPHAEVHAIRSVPDDLKSLLPESVMYVNLEPCSYHGKTPPCSDLIVEHGIGQVVIAVEDPNPEVSGQGIAHLENNGTNVISGIMEEEARWLNRRFFTFQNKRRPHLVLKWAQTSDGFAGVNGKCVQITHNYTRRLVHRWRSEEDAIMVGTETARVDNPRLDTRHWHEEYSPLRIVLDQGLTLPDNLHLFDGSTPTWVITEKEKEGTANVDYHRLAFNEKLLPALLSRLYQRGIISLFVEGGPTLHAHFINAGLWDEARILTSGDRWGRGIKAPVVEGEMVCDDEISGDRVTIINQLTILQN